MSAHDGLYGIEADTMAIVERSLPPVTPPDDLFARILAEVHPESVGERTPPRPRSNRALPTAAAVACVAAVVVLVILIFRGNDGRPVDGRAAITGTGDPAITGEAVLRGADAPGGTMHLSLRDVPTPAAGHHYGVWVLRGGGGGGGEMEAVGTFTPASPHVELDLPLPGPGTYVAVDVSVQRNGGSAAHSATSLATGTFH